MISILFTYLLYISVLFIILLNIIIILDHCYHPTLFLFFIIIIIIVSLEICDNLDG